VAESSSTSNSEPIAPTRTRFPLAFALAIVLVIGADLALRFVPTQVLLTRTASDDEVTALINHIDMTGPATIALVGSSQMRQGVSMPEFTHLVNDELNVPGRIVNYSVRGGKTELMRAIVARLARDKAPPKVILVGLSVRDLRGPTADVARTVPLLTWDEWASEVRNDPSLVGTWPMKFRESVGQWCWSLKFRDAIGARLQGLFVTTAPPGDILSGELARELVSRGRSLVSKPTTKKALLRRMGLSFDMKGSPNASPVMLNYLRQLIEECRRADVRLIVVEMPIAGVMKANLPRKFYSRFHAAIDGLVSSSPQVTFIDADLLTTDFNDRYFFDAQHLNYLGATTFGDRVARRVWGDVGK